MATSNRIYDKDYYKRTVEQQHQSRLTGEKKTSNFNLQLQPTIKSKPKVNSPNKTNKQINISNTNKKGPILNITPQISSNNYDVYCSNSSVFSKIGNDIMIKGNQGFEAKIIRRKHNTNVTMNPYGKSSTNPKGNCLINSDNMENVIQKIIETTKDNPLEPIAESIKTRNLTNNLLNSNSNTTLLNIPLPTGVDRDSLVTSPDTSVYFNSILWECLFDYEWNIDAKQNLNLIVHHIINVLTTHIDSNELSVDLFSVPQLNNAYTKWIKLSFIFLIYLKFILSEFNYDYTWKSSLKKIMTGFNSNWISIIDTFILVKGERDQTVNNCNWLSSDFMVKYSTMLKNHRQTLNKNVLNVNPITFSGTANKNYELLINQIKLMSGTYFKIGYFRPIHNICLDLFRGIDNLKVLTLGKLVIKNVLFYLIHNNMDKPQSTVPTKSIVFNPTNLLSLCGFGNSNQTVPFLPKVGSDVYTLVLDLDETLFHFFFTPRGGSFLIRPYCFEFLEEMSQYYEITVFTAAMKDYADSIWDWIDPMKKWIKHRWYRHHTSISGMTVIKDLSKLGRDLNKTIIIDNLTDNFKCQPNNGWGIKTWCEEIRDTQWSDFAKLWKDIYEHKPQDVRPIIKKIKEQVNMKMKKNVNNPYANITLDKLVL